MAVGESPTRGRERPQPLHNRRCPYEVGHEPIWWSNGHWARGRAGARWGRGGMASIRAWCFVTVR